MRGGVMMLNTKYSIIELSWGGGGGSITAQFGHFIYVYVGLTCNFNSNLIPNARNQDVFKTFMGEWPKKMF